MAECHDSDAQRALCAVRNMRLPMPAAEAVYRLTTEVAQPCPALAEARDARLRAADQMVEEARTAAKEAENYADTLQGEVDALAEWRSGVLEALACDGDRGPLFADVALARIADLRRCERELADVWAAMPGGSEFLDPPDGGDVPLAEQVRRMAAALAAARAREDDREAVERDAERWRALLGSQRVRVLGWARLGQPDAHIGLELWGEYPSDQLPPPSVQDQNRSDITAYADGLRVAAALRPARDGATEVG